VFGRALVGSAREAMITRLRTRPYAYVAQEHLALSQAPVLRGNGLSGFAAKAVTIRVYAFATGAGRIVMPGGLARVAADASVNAVTTQHGGASKDIWVLPDPEHPAPAPESTSGSARTSPRQDLTPSRLVENLYWMGRYTVRCEDKAGLLRATLAVRVEPQVWRSAVRMCQELDVIATDADPKTSLHDDGDPHGLVADIRRLNWCASQVRARLSAGCWQAVLSLQQQLHEGVVAREPPRQTLDRLLLSLAALTGFSLDDMTQDAGWRLLRIGRRLERLHFVARLLARHLAAESANHHGHVEWLLNACDSLRIYRPRYVAAPRLGPTLDLLIRDADHPRAIAFQWQAIARDTQKLAEILQLEAIDALSEAIPALTDSQLLVLEGDGPAAAAARLHLAARLQQLAGAAAQFSDRISMRHFSHTSLDSQALAT
jgi:uncharacterized alpha-E superfamily protein